MKPISLSSVITFIFSIVFSVTTQGQTPGLISSAVAISDCNQNGYFNTSGSGPSLIGPSANDFSNANFGVFTQNSGTLILRGGEIRTSKTDGVSNVCNATMYYRTYSETGTPGAFTSIDLVFMEDCDVPSNIFPSGGPCIAGQQKWNHVFPDGSLPPYAPIDLTSFAAGNYVLEVYYAITGSSTSGTDCNETITFNNSANNYKAFFSIQAPSLESTNPTTCNGTEGTVSIKGLKAGASYLISYEDDGVFVNAGNLTANGSGVITITGLNAGMYSDFKLAANGCVTTINGDIFLPGAVLVPVLASNNPVTCNGTEGSITINGLTAGTTYSISYADDGTTVGPANFVANGFGQVILSGLNAGTYSEFELTTNGCTTQLFTGLILSNPVFTPTFANIAPFCAGATAPSLPTTSNNGITGTWSPSVINNMTSGSYVFTPNPAQCGLTVTKNVTVNPIVTPVFSFGTTLTICAGGGVPTLPSSSSNGVNGTWSPSVVDNQNNGTYTFTPAAGQCATSTSFAVTVTPNITPTFSFGTSLTICEGGSVPSLPSTSSNGINGSWSAASVSNQNSDTYTFTPTAGQCATTAAFSVTVNPNITPTFSFGTSLTICEGGSVPALPTTSDNSISGTWSAAVVDNQNSGTYTFTPSAGQCALPTTLAVTVSANITPTFSFGTSLTICAGGTVPALATTSTENITGTWSPSVVDNQASGTYTFTPAAGQCGLPATFTVNVTPNITPAFSFGSSLTICEGGSVPALATTSDNGISGTWSPAVVDNQASGTYTFTPAAGQCALPTTFNVTVTPNLTPTFSFGTTLSVCAGADVPSLPTVSANGVTGTWSPSTIDNSTSGVYTFTPDGGQCAVATTLSVTVNPIMATVFSFGATFSICSGSTAPILPSTSDNGIQGTWSPAIIDNQASGTYTFTPSVGQCGTTATLFVNVIPTVTPTFSFGTSLTICVNGTVPELPLISENGVAGTWSLPTVSNQSSEVYTFTPTPVPGQCLAVVTFPVTVNEIVTPAFSFGNTLTICAGANVPALPTTSTNGISGTWSPSAISNAASGVYTFTSNPGQCATEKVTLNVTVNTVGTVNSVSDVTVNDGASIPLNSFTGTPGTVNFSWTNSNTAIGLSASGSGNVPSFTAVNTSDKPVSATVTVTPTANNCPGASKSYVITVNPLDKDVFVPNVFSPNGDGKNEVLLVYGNYISKLEMRIFNQWGEQVQTVTDKNKGWDGRHNGKAQPVGVYVYTLKATLNDGRTVNLKGYITLLR